MTLESQYDSECDCIEQEFEEGLVDESEYIQRMKELEQEGRQAGIFADDLPF